MAFTLAQIRADVLNILQKDQSYQGFYTTDKCNRIINESIAYISARMMMEGEGWLQTIGYITTVANTASYTLPTGCSIINSVRYLYSSVYMPLTYDDQAFDSQVAAGTSLTQCPYRYRIVADKLYFNPLPLLVGTNFVQIEYTSYPTALSSDSDTLLSQFDSGLYYYLVYRTASALVAQTGQAVSEWQVTERQWYEVMENIISKRNRVQCVIADFGGAY